MGTRSTTKFIDNNEVLVTAYRQYDGYPTGHGKELAEFLSGIKRIGWKGPAGTANGIFCLAAQFVARFKAEPGDIYLVPAWQEEEWNYEVTEGAGETDWMLRVREEDAAEDYFYGTPQGFLDFLEENKSWLL